MQAVCSISFNQYKKLKPETWKLIPSKQNTSDIMSRGIKVRDFISSKLWFNGPDFLALSVNLWLKLNFGDQFIYDISSQEKVSKMLVMIKIARV